MTFDFSLRSKIDYKILAVGPEAEPMILIDGLMNDPGSLRAFAETEGAYGPAGAAYPGIRCATPEAYNYNLHAGIAPLLHEVFAIPIEKPLLLDASFSMVTEAPRTLRHYQRVPHTDRNGDYNLALVHYLCGPEFGGTGFFRHRATGWQRIDEARLDFYNAALNKELNTTVLPAEFPGTEHPFFERVATISAQFDRMVIYKANLLHSPAIDPHQQFSADPRKGRLTITAFLNPADAPTSRNG